MNKSQNFESEKFCNRDAPVAATPAAFNAEVFATPQEYLATVQKNFSRLSHDHASISLSDLQVDARDESEDLKTRNAAAISAKHFKELLAMRDTIDADTGTFSEPTLTAADIKFFNDMVNHKTVQRGLSAAVGDLKEGAMWGGLGLGAGMGSTAIIDAGTVTLFTGAAAVGVGAFGFGALGIGGYFAFRAATEIHHYNKLANQDQDQVSRWLK